MSASRETAVLVTAERVRSLVRVLLLANELAADLGTGASADPVVAAAVLVTQTALSDSLTALGGLSDRLAAGLLGSPLRVVPNDEAR